MVNLVDNPDPTYSYFVFGVMLKWLYNTSSGLVHIYFLSIGMCQRRHFGTERTGGKML